MKGAAVGARRRVIGTVLLILGLTGLALPVLVAPVTTDGRYHFLMSVDRFPSVESSLVWLARDTEWRLSSGRVSPVGEVYQHLAYWLVMRASVTFGIEVWVGQAVLKALLIVAMVGALAWLLRVIRTGTGEPLAAPTRTLVLIGFAVLVAGGATTTSTPRNGWTTFVVLCVGGVALMLATGALSLKVVNRWPMLSRGGRWAAGALLIAWCLGVVYTYELDWAAYPFAVILVLGQGRGTWRLARRAGDRARWAVVALLTAGFVPGVLLDRWLINRYADLSYGGLIVDLGLPTARTTLLQLVNAVPGSGVSLVARQAQEANANVPPHVFGGGGWLWALVAAAGLVLLLPTVLRRPTAGPASAARDARGDAREGTGWAMGVLAVAALVSALTAAVILSVSQDAARIVSGVGQTYRPTAWIWACFALALAAAAPVVARRRATPVVAAFVAFVTLMGVVVWPYNATAQRLERERESGYVTAAISRQVVLGSSSESAARDRCALARDAVANEYLWQFVIFADISYQDLWGEELCPGLSMPTLDYRVPELEPAWRNRR